MLPVGVPRDRGHMMSYNIGQGSCTHTQKKNKIK